MNHHLSPNARHCSAEPLGLRVFTTRLALENKTQPQRRAGGGLRIPPSASKRVRAQDLEEPSYNELLLPPASHVETGPTCVPRERGHNSADHHPQFPNRGNPISQDWNDLGNEANEGRKGMQCAGRANRIPLFAHQRSS